MTPDGRAGGHLGSTRWRRAGRDRRRERGPRPPRLAAQHDRDRAERASSSRPRVADTDELLERIRKAMHDRFEIDHSTIQVERARPRRFGLLMAATHLECSLTGEALSTPSELHNLSRAGRPLLARYDLELARRTLTRDDVARPGAGDVEMARAAAARRGHRAGQPGRDRNADPAAYPDRRAPRRSGADGQGRGPASDRVVQGARAGDGGDHGAGSSGSTRIAMPTNGNAGAALAAYGAAAGIETIVICPAETPAINIAETARLWRAGVRRRRADRRVRRAGRQGRGRGAVVRLLDAQGALPARGQEGDGVRACRAARLGGARRDLLSDRRRHRADRHVEGVRRTGGGRPDRAQAAADVRGPGRRLRADGPRVRGGRGIRRALGQARRRSRPAFACPRRSAIS